MSNGLRYLLAFAVPLLGAAALTPLAARMAHRWTQIDLVRREEAIGADRVDGPERAQRIAEMEQKAPAKADH